MTSTRGRRTPGATCEVLDREREAPALAATGPSPGDPLDVDTCARPHGPSARRRVTLRVAPTPWGGTGNP